VLPKPRFFGFQAEIEFYQAYFARVAVWVSCDVEHIRRAFDEACRAGLSAMDALHVVVARSSGCDELVTTEKPSEAIHRSTLVHIVSIDP
jgi:predicted nucleic acid-binding protein